jgi:hypothetical protein
MHRSSKPVSLFALGIAALVASHTAGATDWDWTSGFRSEDYGDSKEGPWGLDNRIFYNLVNDHPNATGIYPLTGADTTVSPQSSSLATTDGWSWKIGVKADIPISITNASYLNASYKPDLVSDVFTGTQITLNAPPGAKTAPGWRVCVFYWTVDDDYTDELREDDGTCSKVLSDGCRSDIYNAVATEWAVHTDSFCNCPDLTRIGSCGTPPASFHQGCVAYSECVALFPYLPLIKI